MGPEIDPERLTTGGWWTSVVAGLAFALAGLVVVPAAGLDIGGIDADSQVGQVTWGSLFAGTFLTGMFFWWLLVSRPKRLSLLRGGVAGVLVGLASYVVVLAIAEVLRRGSVLDSPGERTIHVLEFAAFGILTTGFGASLVMAAAGMLLAFGLRPVFPETPTRRGGFARALFKAAGIGAAVLVGLLLLGFVALTLLPLDSAGLRSRPAGPAAPTHEAALAAFDAVQQREAAMALHPRCHSVLLTHGNRVAEAVILLHGFTNCPAQYDELAPKLFALGYNVYVPLLPRHGEADRMTLALVGLTAEEIVATTEDTIDLARGLGEHVAVVGLSGGGTMAAWAGQYRADADAIVAIAPFLAPMVVPAWANRAAMNLMLVLPNVMVSWDPRNPKGTPEMDYAYPRWATHALAQFIRLGEVVGESAAGTAPVAPGLGMLLNEADTAVSNPVARQLIGKWRAHGRDVDEEVFPRSLRLNHDVIDPRQADANTGVVYPVIVDMLERQAEAR